MEKSVIFYRAVGVALVRPPRIDEVRTYAIMTETAAEARLTALHWAAAGCVMPVWDGIDEDVPFLPREWFR